MKYKNYDDLFFTDDFLFSKIMRNPEIAKGVVENLLGIKISKIKFLTSQHTIDELYNGRGIRLDAYIEGTNEIIDVEMQTKLRKDEGLRMRYYQSVIDIESMNKGKTYRELKESYIIFLCLQDPFGKGKAKYSFTTKEDDNSIILNDRTHKIIYNASSFNKAENQEVKAFLSFLNSKRASDKLTKKIQEAVDNSKDIQPWRAEYMLWKDQIREWQDEAQETGYNEGLAKGLADGHAEGLAKGHAEGLAKGHAEGLAKGHAEGLAEGQLKSAIIAVKELNTPVDNAAKLFSVDITKLENLLQEQM